MVGDNKSYRWIEARLMFILAKIQFLNLVLSITTYVFLVLASAQKGLMIPLLTD